MLISNEYVEPNLQKLYVTVILYTSFINIDVPLLFCVLFVRRVHIYGFRLYTPSALNHIEY